MNIGAVLSTIENMRVGLEKGCPFAANLSRDLKISYFPRQSSPLFVRILEGKKGERDFANLTFLKSCLGEFIVAPTKIVTVGTACCGIFPFVTHSRISYDKQAVNVLLPNVQNILILAHEGGRKYRPGRATLSVRDVIATLRNDGLLTNATEAYLDGSFALAVSKMNLIPQHCDFTYTNLGAMENGKLVVFDWEEYGLVCYPGFDFATFLLSHYFHAKAIDAVMNSPDELSARIKGDFGDSFLSKIDLTPVDFMGVFPGYLAVFLAMKKDFGVEIYSRLRTIWQQTVNSDNWMKIINDKRV